MSLLCKFLLTLLFACAVLLAPQVVSANDFSIQPPPPPETLDLPFGESFAITGQIGNLTDQSSTATNLTTLQITGPTAQLQQAGRSVDSTDFTFFFEYDRRALLVQQSLNTANNFFFGLDPGEISPKVGLFDITVLRLGSAQIDTTYSVFAFVRDTAGGQSNTVKIDVTVTAVPEPTTMLLLGSGLAGVAAVRKRRKGLPRTTKG